MGTFNHKNLFHLSVIAFALCVVSFSFNNCGGVGSIESSTVTSQMNYDEKVEALAKLHSGYLPTSFCTDSKNYSCLHKVFSSEALSNASKNAESVCTPLADGTELCPSTQDFLYSTSAAKENCTENCGGNSANGFDAEEYECHLKLSLRADGIYPLVSNEKDFNGAVEKVYQSCLAIQSATQKGSNE